MNNFFKNIFPKQLTPTVLSSSDFCCLNIQTDEILIAYVRAADNNPQLQFCKSYPYKKVGEIKSILAQAVKENHLENIACSWILRHQNYQLIPMEALPVTQAEFQTAIRWKIKDLLFYPTTDAIIDSFDMPEGKGEANKMITVVAARKSFLNAWARVIDESGLKLTTIDIPELALRNITALYEADEKSTSLIYLSDQHIDIIITHKKSLYFSRRLEFGLDHLNAASLSEEKIQEQLDRLSLEIQRSFDYYQTQWRAAAIARVLVAARRSSPEKTVEHLSKRLSLTIEALDINKVITCKENLTLQQQGHFLLVIGGALRQMADYS